MSERQFAAIVLAAGIGTRMKSRHPKVMHQIAGRPMIGHLLATVAALAPARVVVVVGPDMAAVSEAAAPAETVVQDAPLGTGHAVLAARGALADFDGDVVVLYGADPLIAAATIDAALAARSTTPAPAVVVIGMRPDDPGAYARLIIDGDGGLDRIVEARDASDDELAIPLCNAGVVVADRARLFDWLGRVGNDNAKKEYYLTEIVSLARADGEPCGYFEAPAEELIGIDSREDLASAETLVQGQLRARAMAGGVTLIDPASVHLSFDTVFGRDVVVEPNVVFGPGVRVGSDVRIGAFSHLEGAQLGDGVTVGPFARLRQGAEIAAHARIGNFVEVKNASVEAGAKIMHLSYLGDARLGAGANVGAGTITCNYDGVKKSHTDIGAGAFIGSNTALVAPVTIGDGAVVGAGSVITRDVPGDALALTRAPQETREGWAKRLHQAKAQADSKRRKD